MDEFEFELKTRLAVAAVEEFELSSFES